MDALQVEYEYWMNHHVDKTETEQAWMRFEREVNKAVPQETKELLELPLKTYLCELEMQAYRSGFAAGVRLASACFA